MYTVYPNGQEFLNENLGLLNQNPTKTAFMVMDAHMIEQTTSQNYAIRVEENGKVLLALHCQDVPLLVYGSQELCPQLVDILIEKGFFFDRVLADELLCESVLSYYCKKVGGKHKVNLRMDIMQCQQVAPFDASLVEWATKEDIEQIVALDKLFAGEVGIPHDEQKARAKLEQDIGNYAVIRKDSRIVSLAKFSKRTEKLYSINMVYTYPLYRNKGYSRKVVSIITQKLLNEGKTVYLFVDKTNPISNGLYQSIGYRYVSPQFEYQYIAEQ